MESTEIRITNGEDRKEVADESILDSKSEIKGVTKNLHEGSRNVLEGAIMVAITENEKMIMHVK